MITKKQREDAATVCRLAVSEDTVLYDVASRMEDVHDGAAFLAYLAWEAVDDLLPAPENATRDEADRLFDENCIEAAALLDEGWCPGDAIEVRS